MKFSDYNRLTSHRQFVITCHHFSFLKWNFCKIFFGCPPSKVKGQTFVLRMHLLSNLSCLQLSFLMQVK